MSWPTKRFVFFKDLFIYYILTYMYVSSLLFLSENIRGAFNKFPDFFVLAFKIVVDSWKFSMLLLYILWDDWPIFMISGSNQQLRQQLEYTLLKPDCHSWWISKMQSGREDTLEERYAIKFCFKLGKNATETYWMLQTAFQSSCMNLQDSRRSDRANPPTNFWWSLFLTALAWSSCTRFPLDRQSTRNTMLRF